MAIGADCEAVLLGYSHHEGQPDGAERTTVDWPEYHFPLAALFTPAQNGRNASYAHPIGHQCAYQVSTVARVGRAVTEWSTAVHVSDGCYEPVIILTEPVLVQFRSDIENRECHR